MDSTLIIRIHTISVMLFLLTYLVKTILLLTNRKALDKYSLVTKVPEMIISTIFLVTGVWLYIIIGGIKVMHIVKLVCVFISIPLAVIGFKKHKKGLAIISLFLIICAYGIAEMSRSQPFIPANTTLSTNSTDPLFTKGALVFHENCAFCHGADGKKMYRNSPDLTKSVTPPDIVKQMILEGSKGKMPAYKIIISDENIEAVAKYVEGLRPLRDSLN